MMEGYYLFLAACVLFHLGAVSGWEDMCSDVRKTFSRTVSLSQQAYPDYTDRKHCQCNVTTDYNSDVLLQLQLHREAFNPHDNSGCSPRLMVAVVDREMQESGALRNTQAQDIESILRPSVGVCPMPHEGPFTSTRSFVTMRSSQQLTVTFQNPSAHKTKFYISLSASPVQKVKVTCGSLVVPPPILVEETVATPIHKRGSEIGAIVACVIIGVFIIAIFIIAYCKVKMRDRNRSQSGAPNNNRRNVGKNTPDKGRGNPGFEETPRSSVGDVSKNKPNDLDGRWNHPSGVDGRDNDLIPHDFLRRISSPNPTDGSSPRHLSHYHHEPASLPVRAQPNILSPTSNLREPGYPHQPIMDPIFAETPLRDPRPSRGSRVSFPEADQDSFDSPYTKPVPGSPSINAPSDSGYTGSDVHVPSHLNHEDTTSDISALPDDQPPNRSPDSGRPMSYRSASPLNRSYTPDHLQQYPGRNFPPDINKKFPQHPYTNQPNEYANLGFDPEEAEPMPSKVQPVIPVKEYPNNTSPIPIKEYPNTTSPLPIKEYPNNTSPLPIKEYPYNASPLPVKEYPQRPNILPVKGYPLQSASPPVRDYPTDPVDSQPMKGISPAFFDQQPSNIHPYEPVKQAYEIPEPRRQGPKKKKKKGPRHVMPQAPMKTQTPEPIQEEPAEPVSQTPIEREFTPDPIQQFRPISPDPSSACASPVSMVSGSRTPMGRSPYPQSPLIPPLGIDEGPYVPPSPWRMPYIYKQEPLMYIDDTDSESVVSSMSTRDLYVRSHKELMNQSGSLTPVMRDPYRPSSNRPPAQYRPETISETDV